METVRVGEKGSRAAIAGFVFAGLFVVGWFLMQKTPSLDDSVEVQIAYYSDSSERWPSVLAGLYVLPFAAIAFVWFVAALRDRYVGMSRREHTLLSTVHLLSGTLFVASLFSLAATELALVWLAEAEDGLDPSSVRVLLALGQATSSIMALRSAAVFVAVSATRAARSGLFPRSYAVASFVVALVMLFAFGAWPVTALLMPAWVLVTSVLVMSRRPSIELADGT